MKICNSKQKTITIWIFSFDVFFFYWIIGDNDKKRLLIDKLTSNKQLANIFIVNLSNLNESVIACRNKIQHFAHTTLLLH